VRLAEVGDAGIVDVSDRVYKQQCVSRKAMSIAARLAFNAWFQFRLLF
jgi:hypothetical protein